MARLAGTARLGPDRLLALDVPVAQAVASRPDAAEAVARHLEDLAWTPGARPEAVAATLLMAQRLAESQPGAVAARIAPTAARFNTHPNALVQIYLAGLYRVLNLPETFGPMLATLLRTARQREAGPLNPTEEVGGTVLQLLANRTADEVLRRLWTLAAMLPAGGGGGRPAGIQ